MLSILGSVFQSLASVDLLKVWVGEMYRSCHRFLFEQGSNSESRLLGSYRDVTSVPRGVLAGD